MGKGLQGSRFASVYAQTLRSRDPLHFELFPSALVHTIIQLTKNVLVYHPSYIVCFIRRKAYLTSSLHWPLFLDRRIEMLSLVSMELHLRDLNHPSSNGESFLGASLILHSLKYANLITFPMLCSGPTSPRLTLGSSDLWRD